MEFAKRLKEIREKKGETQDDVAKVLMVSRATIAGYETKGKQPDYSKLIKLSQHFNVSVDYLIGNSDYPDRLEYIPADSYIVIDIDGQKKIIKVLPQQKERLLKLIEAGFPELMENAVTVKDRG